jgi:hypothetical protein
MSILRGSALEILGHCHNMCVIHQVMQLLLDSMAQQMSKISLKRIITNATIRTTATPCHTQHQTGNLAVGMCRRHKAAPRTARIGARSVFLSSKSAIFSSMSTHLTAKMNSH